MFRKPPEPTGIDLAIEDILAELKGFTADTDEYAKIMDQLCRLHAMKIDERSPGVSRDTMANIVGNLMGILLILEFERTNVITSKAMSFVSKLK